MKIYSTKTQIESVAKRWYFAHYTAWSPPRWVSADNKRIYEQLLALDRESATEDDVTKIIGNRNWTRITCNECGENVQWAMEMGESPDYESATAIICIQCLDEAVQMLEKES